MPWVQGSLMTVIAGSERWHGVHAYNFEGFGYPALLVPALVFYCDLSDSEVHHFSPHFVVADGGTRMQALLIRH